MSGYENDPKREFEADAEKRRREKEPIGTTEPIPGYGQPPEGIRTLRLPDVAPKRDGTEEPAEP